MSLKNFWGTVLQCTTEIVEELPRNQYCSRAKVYQPDVKTLVNDDVLVFNVPVDDVLGSQIKYSSNKLEEKYILKDKLSQCRNGLCAQ